jgi:hypothetical protein
MIPMKGFLSFFCCYRLNWMLSLFDFPVRGMLIYDEMEMIRGASENDKGIDMLPIVDHVQHGRVSLFPQPQEGIKLKISY